MSNSENSGNPTSIGMDSSDFSEGTNVQTTPTKAGSNEFFNSLDQEVNGQIRDTEVTPSQKSGPVQVTHAKIEKGSNNVVEQSQNSTDWQKRYTDSSREAVKWRDRFKSVEPFVPVLEAMKNDSGLVDHVRNYLQSGGKPAASIQDKLKLDEDFVFDQQEAMTNPESDSAKVMDAHVDGLVRKRVGEMTLAEQRRSKQLQQSNKQKTDEEAFMKKHSMSAEQFAEFKVKAKSHVMTLEDINHIINKDKVSANVAQSTKKDMLKQMKSVQNMPSSASGANNQGAIGKSQDREVFENILGFESGKDNLFG